MSKGDKPVKNNSKEANPEIAIKKHLNADKILIKKLKCRKKAYNEFLSQINDFIEYAQDQAKNNNDNELRIKYLGLVEEEESLLGKIQEHLKKNDDIIESIKKSTDALFR